jgi:hypothetical protein
VLTGAGENLALAQAQSARSAHAGEKLVPLPVMAMGIAASAALPPQLIDVQPGRATVDAAVVRLGNAFIEGWGTEM